MKKGVVSLTDHNKLVTHSRQFFPPVMLVNSSPMLQMGYLSSPHTSGNHTFPQMMFQEYWTLTHIFLFERYTERLKPRL